MKKMRSVKKPNRPWRELNVLGVLRFKDDVRRGRGDLGSAKSGAIANSSLFVIIILLAMDAIMI